MRVLGVDPSLTSTGIALVEAGSVLKVQRVRSKKTGHDRVEEILRAIYDAAFQDGQPALVGIEGPAMGAKGSAVVQIFGLWCTITHQLWKWKLPYYVVPPSSLKVYATGKGNASKDEVLAAVVRRYLDVEVTGNDVADALTIAAIGARHHGDPLEAVMSAAHLRALEGVKWPE